MFNGSLMSDNKIKQNAEVPYEKKDKRHALEKQNTIVVSNKKSLKSRLKQLFRKNKSTE